MCLCLFVCSLVAVPLCPLACTLVWQCLSFLFCRLALYLSLASDPESLFHVSLFPTLGTVPTSFTLTFLHFLLSSFLHSFTFIQTVTLVKPAKHLELKHCPLLSSFFCHFLSTSIIKNNFLFLRLPLSPHSLLLRP